MLTVVVLLDYMVIQLTTYNLVMVVPRDHPVRTTATTGCLMYVGVPLHTGSKRSDRLDVFEEFIRSGKLVLPLLES